MREIATVGAVSESFNDPRWRDSEGWAIEAEHAAERGELSNARALYRRAAAQAGEFALSADGTLPRTRSIAAVAAVVLAARGGDFRQAVTLAELFLASPQSLIDEGITELKTLRTKHLRAQL